MVIFKQFIENKEELLCLEKNSKKDNPFISRMTGYMNRAMKGGYLKIIPVTRLIASKKSYARTMLICMTQKNKKSIGVMV